MNTRTDAELLAAWGTGNERAGAELFSRHYPAIARFFRNKVPREAQEDLVQRTFLACVEGRSRFRGDGSLRAYLFGIAHRLLYSYFRERRGRHARLDTTVTSAYDLAPGPSSIMARRSEHELLVEALRRIPLDYQVVLELHYWEELTAAQIAEIVDLPVGTAKTRLRRARELVREQLQALASRPRNLSGTIDDCERWADELREQLIGER